jgi:hypothetical protein
MKKLFIIFILNFSLIIGVSARELNYDCKFSNNPELNSKFKFDMTHGELIEVNGTKIPKTSHAKRGGSVDVGALTIDTFTASENGSIFWEINTNTKEVTILIFTEFTKEEFLKIRVNTLKKIESNIIRKKMPYEGVIRDMKSIVMKDYKNKLVNTIKGQCSFI